MTSAYHCYQPVGSVAVYARPEPDGDNLLEPQGTPLLITLVDHDDDYLHYGVVPLLRQPKKMSHDERRDTKPRFTVLPGYELYYYDYVQTHELEFADND